MKWVVLGFMLLLHASVTQTLTLAWGPRVLRKFTYLRLSSLHCYICPCISNQALCQQNVLGIQRPIDRFAQLLMSTIWCPVRLKSSPLKVSHRYQRNVSFRRGSERYYVSLWEGAFISSTTPPDDICYRCQETDSGVYTCLASSSSGETSWSGVLTVKGKASLHAALHA